MDVEVKIKFQKKNGEGIEETEFRRLIALLKYLHDFTVEDTDETQIFDVQIESFKL